MYRVIISSIAAMLPLMSMTQQASAAVDHDAWKDGQNLQSPFMRVYGDSRPPIGHVRFCRTHPDDCKPRDGGTRRFALSPDRWRELVSINAMVNRNVEPTADQELYGEIERWTYPDKAGDCEDYVLLKRRMLMQHGWPASSLLITVVTDENGEGHAVLTARTSSGDYVLDNKHSKVLAWNKVPYRFYKRQSYRHPSRWVALKPMREVWRTSSNTIKSK